MIDPYVRWQTRKPLTDQVYVYNWNRQGRKGQRCWVIARGKRNSCLLRFEDNELMVTSRNALRKELLMLVRDSKWEEIRTQFSEEEKVKLRGAVTGETICPRGFTINPDSLPEELRNKITKAVRGN